MIYDSCMAYYFQSWNIICNAEIFFFSNFIWGFLILLFMFYTILKKNIINNINNHFN